MTKYILSRFSLFFLLKFFYLLITNTGGQLQVFFGLSSYSGWYDISRISLAGLYVVLAAIIINAIFYIWVLSDVPEVRTQLKKYSFKYEVKYFFRHFFRIAQDNLDHEIQREKSTGSFGVFAIIFIFFIQSNSVFYNYTGVHKEYTEYTYNGEERIREEGAFILPKHEEEWISTKAKDLIEEHREWHEEEPDFNIITRNFLFVESGFIRGYKPQSRNDQYHRKGFWNYLRALFLFSIEVFVITLLAFTIFLFLLGLKYYLKIKEPKKAKYAGFFLAVLLATTACEQTTTNFADGKYEAIVKYYNPKTGSSSTYTLDVELKNDELKVIYWPNGGWLDDSHFNPPKISSGKVSFKDDRNVIYEVDILQKLE